MEISYSMSFGNAPTPPAPEKLWAFCGVDLMPAPDHAVLLRRQDDDRRHFVRRDVAAVLDHSRHFKTLQEHADAAGNIVPELKGQSAQVLPVLRQMAELGFLRSGDELLARWKTDPIAEPMDPPKVFIITCDRPTALERLLRSLADNPENGAFEITVIDDSRGAESLAANAAVTKTFAKTSPLNTQYFGLEERERLIQRLVSALPEHEAPIRFLIDRDRWPGQPTYGLARNLALLLSVGSRLIILDDDIIAHALPSPGSKTASRFGSVNDRKTQFYTDQTDMLEDFTPLAESPLTLCSRQLGLTLGELVAQHGIDTAALRGSDSATWWALDASASVAMTQCGTFGDPGTGDNANWIINLSNESHEQLAALNQPIEKILSARATWMGYQQPTVMRFGAMSQLTGLDNRELLPPYIPVQRGEDFLFGVMLEKIAPQSVVLGEAWGVPHLPTDRSGLVTLSDNPGAKPSVHALALWLDRVALPTTSDRPHRLKHLASTIEATGSWDDRHATSFICAELTKQQLTQLDQLNQCAGNSTDSISSELLTRVEQWRHELQVTLQSPRTTEEPGGLNQSLATQKITQWAVESSAGLRTWILLRNAVSDH